MFTLFAVLDLAYAGQGLGDSVTDGTTLISTILVHRHGDRTPISETVAFTTNPDAVEVASAPFGYGQLTNVGKQRAYNLGKFIRARYDELLSPQYDQSEIYIRSTDSARAKMTILTAMAAVYPASPGNWNEEINWVPTPYTTVPVKYDFVHRHGDRTPISETVAFTTNPDAVEVASAPFGYGQLTNVGKQRAYNLGKFIRARYDELLSPQYDQSEIYIRSTDSARAKMTILTAMAAVYPASPGNWNEEINWVPTPYTTVPVKYDFNLAFLNCPVFVTSFLSALSKDSPRMDEYFDVLKAVSAVSGRNVTKWPVMVYNFYDAYISQESLGVPLRKEIADIMDRLREAAGVAMDVLFGDANNIALQAGVLLHEFFTQADNLISGAATPQVRIYSGHDTNVYAFEAVARVSPRQGVPKYASAFALELRQVDDSKEYVVLPVYQASPGEDVIYLSVSGCDSLLCPYDNYKKLVSNYTLDEDTWRSECGFTNNLVIDDSSID